VVWIEFIWLRIGTTEGFLVTATNSGRPRILMDIWGVSSKVDVTLRLTVSQSVLVSSTIWGLWPDIYYCLTVTVLSLCGALSDERTGLSFVYAAGPCQLSLSRVRVPLDSRPYFAQIWDFPSYHLLRLAGWRWRYSTPPPRSSLCSLGTDRTKTPLSTVTPLLRVTQPLHSNGCLSYSTAVALSKYATL
jgi:hypothetical protein